MPSQYSNSMIIEGRGEKTLVGSLIDQLAATSSIGEQVQNVVSPAFGWMSLYVCESATFYSLSLLLHDSFFLYVR